MNTRWRIGLSACLLGHAVRYDGEHKRDDLICTFLSEHAELIPLCPEVAIGMGVPRPKIQWMEHGSNIAVRQLDNPTIDVTQQLYTLAEQHSSFIATLHGLILKSRSPSCAVHDAPVLMRDASVQPLRAGAFSERVQQLFPDLPICDEKSLQSLAYRQHFLHLIAEYAKHRMP